MKEETRKKIAWVLGRLHIFSLARSARCCFQYLEDARYDIRHLGGLKPENATYRMACLILLCHKIEKGLCMPEFRKGFGQDAVWQLLQLLESYLKSGFGPDHVEINEALSVLHEYRKVHQEIGYSLDARLLEKIGEVVDNADFTPHGQLQMSAESYWAHTHAEFPLFAASRHSVRDFCGKVSYKQIEQAISLACTAPSACNRQHVRVHTYEDEKATALLSLQNGNRGFGHLCKQLIVVTADRNALFTTKERHDGYTNGGIFAMNLSYSLHYYHVGHCILNWSTTSSVNAEFKKLAEIPDNEVVVLLMACGQVKESFKVARSARRPADEIYTRH